MHQGSRPEAVVRRFVPFVTQHALRQGGHLAGLDGGHGRVAPGPQQRRTVRNGDRVGPEGIHLEYGAGERVFRASAVGWRTEARVAPCARPLAGRVDLGDCVRLLVGHERPVRGAGRVGFPARLPVDLVSADEDQMHAGVARGLHIGALVSGPVFVVADRHEDLVVGERMPARPGIDPGDVGDVEAVALQPADRRIFAAEHEVLGAGIGADAVAGHERPVVADLVGAAVRACRGVAAIEAGAAPAIIGVPGRVGGLEDDVARHAVTAHDEWNVAGAGGCVLPHELCDVDAGNRVRRHRPSRRDRPVAGVHQADRRIAHGRRLHGGRVLLQRRDQACAEAGVVAEAVDVDPVIGGIGVDLEGNRRALIDADARGEALDGAGRRPVEVPFALGIPRLLVFDHNRIQARHRSRLLLGHRHDEVGRAACA